MRSVRPIVWLILFFSGVSGLIYEIIWTRQLTLVFGSTVFAVSTVLTGFMAGLALGSFYFGRLADREERPLRLYALLEVGIGVFALIFPLLLSILNAIYILVYRGLNAEFYSLSLIRFVLSFFVLLIPTTLMGGTLPVISKFFVERLEKLGSNVGTLYALNTFGAVAGCIAAGFFLVQFLGVRQSLYLGAAINLIVAVVAFGVDRRWTGSSEEVMNAIRSIHVESRSKDSEEIRNSRLGSDTVEEPPPFRLVLWAFAISGFCALAYEVLWTRILVFFLGSTTYAFSTMLAAFLFGIAFGSFLFGWIADRVRSLVNLFGLVQIGIGLFAIVLMPAFGELYGISSALQSVFGGGRIWAFAACIIVMIIPTLLMGGCFPLVTRIYTRRVDRLGHSIGNVYAINTIGAIAGSFCAGFILIPLIGIRPSIILMGVLNTIIGCILIFRGKGAPEARQLFSGAAIGGAILTAGFGLIVLFLADKPLFLKSAIFRTQRPGDTIVDYKEEVDATVTTLKDEKGVHRLYVDTNQAAENSRWDSPSHRVIAHLPLLLHPDPKRALVVGFGMGLTSYSITQHGVHVNAVEISKGIIDAAREHFPDVNHNIFDNTLFNYTINDGRNHILMTGKKYDMISTGIIHPLVSAGSSNIYTADFYKLCKRILTEDGVMCQWVPLHRLPEAHYKMIVRTFLQVFPHTTLWYKYTPDFVILIGTPEKLKIDYRNFMERTQIASIRDGLAYDDLDGMSLLDSFMMGEDTIRRYVGDGPVHTDNRPRLEAFRAKDLANTTPKNIEGMVKYREHVTPRLINYGQTLPQKAEVRKQINRYFDATQKLIRGQIAYAGGQYGSALGLFTQALAINPDDNAIRYNHRVAARLVREEDQAELKQLEQLVKRTLRSNPTDVEGHFQLAVIYEGQGKLAEAAKTFEKAIEYAPNRREFFILLGPIYERQERYDEALRTYRRLEKLAPDLPAAIFAVMASIYHLKEMPSEALEYAQKALKADSNSWQGHYLLGNIYAAGNAVEKAIDAYQQAIKLAPNEPVPHSELANFYLTQKRYGEALKSIDEAIRLAPNEPAFREKRSQIQEAMQ